MKQIYIVYQVTLMYVSIMLFSFAMGRPVKIVLLNACADRTFSYIVRNPDGTRAAGGSVRAFCLPTFTLPFIELKKIDEKYQSLVLKTAHINPESNPEYDFHTYTPTGKTKKIGLLVFVPNCSEYPFGNVKKVDLNHLDEK